VSCRSTEEWEHNGVQRSTTEKTNENEVSCGRSEFRESAVEGIRLCQEDLEYDFSCSTCSTVILGVCKSVRL
jgi:hypothetical protein